jgi:phosphoribosylaminoimidazolecarboxamide formyltransferase / IMP cyclohydrolase
MEENMKRLPIRRALISVYDKTGVSSFAHELVDHGVVVISSGGTAKHLRDAGVAVVDVAEVTGADEMLGGRVKTLHPTIHGAILANRSREDHLEDLAAREISMIDLVVVNLYPFEATVADPSTTPAEAIEKIDIGGPTMVRSAAKNYEYVTVITTPSDYASIVASLDEGGTLLEERAMLARKAFAHTAVYDAAIVRWFDRDEELPVTIPLSLERVATLRYGENPHQPAAIYAERGASGWWHNAVIHQGKAMSFNNYADTEAAWRLVNDLADPGVVVMKHMNACGAGEGATLSEAFDTAWACDPVSAFGGIVALNGALDGVTAARIVGKFVEVVIAPSLTTDAAQVLAAKKNLRVVTADIPGAGGLDMRRTEAGMLVQRRDVLATSGGHVPPEWSIVSDRVPTDEEMRALRFAWTVAGHTKSNAIVIAQGRAAVGVGAGDQSRVGAAQRALVKAGDRAAGGVAASDAFLPFRDALDVLAAAGVRAVVEPGGSKRDDEVIAAANESGVSLVFTNQRHFRH